MRLVSNPLTLIALGASLGIVGCGPLSYVTPDEWEEKRCSLDEDGDGSPKCDFENGSALIDCNDLPEKGGENETPGAEEIPYDGYDNDCDGSDVVDWDGDNYPGISRAAYEAVFEADDRLDIGDIDFEWTANLKEIVDCDDYDNQIYDGSPAETAYDGVDSDCGFDNDFDADIDGYMPDTVVIDKVETSVPTLYAAYVKKYPDYDLGKPQYGDCDDTRADSYPGAAGDLWYDGVDHDCAGNNDFDQDVDGFMPDQDANQSKYSAYIAYYGYTFDEKWGDCEDVNPVTVVAGKTVQPEDINPDAADCNSTVAAFDLALCYDGVDSDCLIDNDFDHDYDTWMPNGYEADFDAFVAWWSTNKDAAYADLDESGYNDCDDDDDTVHPTAMEYLGDAVDQDCNGFDDTTTFGFGNYLVWDMPRKPVLGVTADKYVMSTAADEVERDGVAPKTNTGISLLFDLDATFEPVPTEYLWSGGSTNPMGHAIDMITFDEGFYLLYSYFQENATYTLSLTQLMLYKNTWTGSGYSPAYYQYDWDYNSDPYMDMDLQIDDDGHLWGVATGDTTLHWYQVEDTTTDFTLLDGDTHTDWSYGGHDLIYDLGSGKVIIDDSVSGDELSWTGDGTVLDPSDVEGLNAFAVDDPLDGTVVVPQPWRNNRLISTATHGDWTLGVLGAGGVTAKRISGAGKVELFDGEDLFDADVVFYDADGDGEEPEMVYAVAVYDPDEDEVNEVVLRYGDPAVLDDDDDMTVLTEAIFELDDGTTEYDVDYAGIHVDDERIFIGAVAADAVGWLFMGWPPS